MTRKPVSPPPFATDGWFKSSYSGGEGSSCVEVADFSSMVGIRDSKDKTMPALAVPADAWSSFVSAVRTTGLA